MSDQLKSLIGDVFRDIARGLESGNFAEGVKVGITLLGSELGDETLLRGAEAFAAANPHVEVVLIGPEGTATDLTVVPAASEEEQHKVMEGLLDEGRIQACVTQHYNFPIGVSTVGKVITPGLGKPMFLATTTGTSSAHRVEAMVKNAVAGVVAAKTCGIEQPTIGILNVDGARQVERALKELQAGGYDLHFAQSARADGGSVMRGNDLLQGTPDVMVTDSLTGNLLQKTFSSFHTGGNYEAVGQGYGPGIGEGYGRIILILSRVSGLPVIEGALAYAATLAQNNLLAVAKREYEAAHRAGFKGLLEKLSAPAKQDERQADVKQPPAEVVTGSISGIDIMELENAVRALWKEDIYAESGMGCTGPIVMVNEARLSQAITILEREGYASQEKMDC